MLWIPLEEVTLGDDLVTLVVESRSSDALRRRVVWLTGRFRRQDRRRQASNTLEPGQSQTLLVGQGVRAYSGEVGQ